MNASVSMCVCKNVNSCCWPTPPPLPLFVGEVSIGPDPPGPPDPAVQRHHATQDPAPRGRRPHQPSPHHGGWLVCWRAAAATGVGGGRRVGRLLLVCDWAWHGVCVRMLVFVFACVCMRLHVCAHARMCGSHVRQGPMSPRRLARGSCCDTACCSWGCVLVRGGCCHTAWREPRW